MSLTVYGAEHEKAAVPKVSSVFNSYEVLTDKDSCSSRYVNVHKLRPKIGALWSGERAKVTSTSPDMGDVGRVHSRVNGFIQDYRVALEQKGCSNTI